MKARPVRPDFCPPKIRALRRLAHAFLVLGVYSLAGDPST